MTDPLHTTERLPVTTAEPLPTNRDIAPFEHVAVIGCGIMGSGIAQTIAATGVPVTVCELDLDALARGKSRVLAGLDRSASKNSLTPDAHRKAQQSLTWTTDLSDLVHCDLVIEAVAEIEQVKVDLFRRLDALPFGEGVILATNTSSIPVIKLATVTSRPERVIGLHFFNPVPVMELVEIIPSLLTSHDAVTRMRKFVEGALNKTPVTAQDKAGFIVNALLIPYLLDAVRMVESGTATAADVDNAMRLGCAHPMGPLALADLIGLDTVASIAESLHHEFGKQDHLPPPLLRRMVDADLLGRKTGQGFHRYD
ncbi:3-hydroxybutyryl-CoA dehydrogenase [Rhodococcus opacus]